MPGGSFLTFLTSTFGAVAGLLAAITAGIALWKMAHVARKVESMSFTFDGNLSKIIALIERSTAASIQAASATATLVERDRRDAVDAAALSTHDSKQKSAP